MPSNLVVDITPSELWKAEKASRRGKATARQAALTEIEAELEDVVSDRDPDDLPWATDFTPIIQSFWADESGELHVEAQVHASFVIPSSETSEALKRLLNILSEPNT
jgi:hypothetical protein